MSKFKPGDWIEISNNESWPVLRNWAFPFGKILSIRYAAGISLAYIGYCVSFGKDLKGAEIKTCHCNTSNLRLVSEDEIAICYLAHSAHVAQLDKYYGFVVNCNSERTTVIDYNCK